MKLPKSYYNWLSISGSMLALISLALIFILFIFGFVYDVGSAYLGLFMYIIIPIFLVFGLVLIPIGMYFRNKRLKTNQDLKEFKLPLIDLNEKGHRNALLIFSIFTFFFLFLSSLGTYEAFHYSESVEFCGTLCHKVMEPEYTTYQHSAHARVACVECHVGSGAEWYVQAKLTGLYQVYSVIRELYSRPIETPLHNLRPAKETCEKCHWPEKFYDRKLVTQKSFLADSLNTEWDITLQMKTGPIYNGLGMREGIHWHINPNVKVEYISDDDTREMIPWVKYTNLETGEVTIYEDEENILDDSLVHQLTPRIMDCMDCHNRPSHVYLSPPNFIDNALVTGAISSDIPFIKKIAMEVLIDPFDHKDSAMIYINDEVNRFYELEDSVFYAKNKGLIQKAIKGIQNAYLKNVFPEMRVQYDVYPDHIGHLEFNGCFRCHSGKHNSKQGKTISRDCNLCHTIIAQGPANEIMSVPIFDTLEFIHPVPIDGEWKETCVDCHTYLY